MLRSGPWNDPRHAVRVARSERLTGAVTPFLLEALAPRAGERILEIGCGAGAATMRIADAVGRDGVVAGVDISRPVLEETARRLHGTGYEHVSLQVADAQRDSVAGGPFDAATSQFGTLFFDDPVAAYANIRRHLVATGRMCFTCWQSADGNPWSYAAELADLLPGDDRPSRGPFSLSDDSYVRRVLEQAGFRDVDVTAHGTTVVVPEDTVLDDTELVLMGVAADRLDEARARAREKLSPYGIEPGLLRLPLAFFAVTAR